ncbi:MAG: hypothetical protein ACYC1W_04205 [Gemmatimonadaceae bacterium]
MSSGRDHAAGGAAPPLGKAVAVTSDAGVFTTGATAAGGAAPAQPMLVGQDGHDGVPSPDAAQQSVARIVGVAFADGSSADVRLLA